MVPSHNQPNIWTQLSSHTPVAWKTLCPSLKNYLGPELQGRQAVLLCTVTTKCPVHLGKVISHWFSKEFRCLVASASYSLCYNGTTLQLAHSKAMTPGSLCHLWESRKIDTQFLNLWAHIRSSSPPTIHTASCITKNLGQHRNSYRNRPTRVGVTNSTITKPIAARKVTPELQSRGCLGWLAGQVTSKTATAEMVYRSVWKVVDKSPAPLPSGVGLFLIAPTAVVSWWWKWLLPDTLGS